MWSYNGNVGRTCYTELGPVSWLRLRVVFMYGRRTHSTSASLCSSVPSRISYGRRSNRGPTSARWTSRCVATKTWCRKLMKSFRLANVITRRASSFGTGKRNRSALFTRSPRRPPNPSKIKCGNCSLTVELPWLATSCRRVTLCKVNMTVGPCGKCETTIASGTPRCSCTTIMSVIPFDRAAAASSGMVYVPRFIRVEFGNTRRSSFANWDRRDEGLRAVVIRIRGSYWPAREYSSSIDVDGSSWAASKAKFFASASASGPRSSGGSGLPLAKASRIFCFRS